MKKNFRKLACLLAALVIVLGTAATAFAAVEPGGKVTYQGEAEQFVFQYGSEYSKTDLFSDLFKGVMPGDVIEDNITVRNNESDDYMVEIFMRATGPAELEKHDTTDGFLNQMNLTVVEQISGYDDTELFDATAEKTDGLTEWTSLGVFQSGAEVNLKLLLEVPKSMDDRFQNAIGALNWEFKVQAYEIPEESTEAATDPKEEASDESGPAEEEPSEEPDKDKGTQTGDDSNMIVPLSLMGIAILAIILALAGRRRKQAQ